MSGGHFNYKQFQINEIASDIQKELDNQGKEKSKEDLYTMGDYYEKYPEERFNQTYPIEIQEEFKRAVMALKLAAIYAHRIDWFLSGDDGEDRFLSRLKDDIEKLNVEK